MAIIYADEVEATGPGCFMDKIGGPIEDLGVALLAVTKGAIGGLADMAALNDVLLPMHERAVEQLEPLPELVRALLYPEPGVRRRWWLLSDNAGTFCLVAEGKLAQIGPGHEIAHLLTVATMAASRRVSLDPDQSQHARHRAAVVLQALRPVAVTE